MIGIVILNYRGPSKVEQLVGDLRACRRPEVPTRLYLVDNASNDQSAEVLTALAAGDSSVSVILNRHNSGYGPGNNIGIRAAIEDGCMSIILLNPDVRIMDANFLLRCQQVAQHLPPTVGIVSPRILESSGRVHADIGVLNVATGTFTAALKGGGQLGRAEFPLGCTLLIQAEFARTLAGTVFRENLFLYGEELFLKLDAERAGYTCWSIPDITVIHEGMESSAQGSISDGFRRRLADRNLLWYARERYGTLGPAYQAWLSAWVLMRSMVRAAINRDWGQVRTTVSAVHGGWAERTGAEGTGR